MKPADRNNPNHRAAALEWCRKFAPTWSNWTLDDVLPHAMIDAGKLWVSLHGIPHGIDCKDDENTANEV